MYLVLRLAHLLGAQMVSPGMTVTQFDPCGFEVPIHYNFDFSIVSIYLLACLRKSQYYAWFGDDACWHLRSQ